MIERYLENRGLYYRVNHFEPGRPTLLLIHGFSASSSGWAAFEPWWEHKYNLIIPDLRGHGLSKRYPRYRDYAPYVHAQDLAVLIDRLKVAECALVGYSFGSEIALQLYLLRRSRVRKVVLVTPTYKMGSLWRVKIGRPFIAAGALASTLLPAGLAVAGHVDYRQYKDDGDESAGRIISDMVRTGPRAYFYSLQQIFEYQDTRWHELKCPTLIIRGKDDTMVPRSHTEDLARSIPDARVEIIENGGHMLPYHNPRQVADAVEAFVN